MVELPVDPLATLTAELPAEGAQRARDLVTFMRVLWNDTTSSRRSTVRVDVARAEAEVERANAGQEVQQLESALGALLDAALPEDSFCDYRCGARTTPGAARSERIAVQFGETPPVAAERLLRELGATLLSAERRTLWEARLIRAQAGPAAGLAALDERRAQLAAQDWRTDAAACELDLGRVRSARERLGPATSPRAQQLERWARLLSGEQVAAWSAPVGVRPAALARGVTSEGAPLFGGALRPRSRPPRARDLERQAFGASLLAVVAFDGARCELVRWDAAPALEHAASTWAARRDGAWALAAEPEHVVVAREQVVVWRHGARRPTYLVSKSARAAAFVPILAGAAGAIGWLYFEWPHELVPTETRLRTLVPAALAELAAARSGAERVTLVESAGTVVDARRACLQRIVGRMATKFAQRRWFGIEFDGAQPRLVASGGDGLPARRDPGRTAAALARVRRSHAVLRTERDDLLHQDARSGVVLPFAADERLAGALLVESSRRQDFKENDLARMQACVEAGLPEWRAAQFADWYQARFGRAVCTALESTDMGRVIQELEASARGRDAVAIVGEHGVGKGVFARWLHFASAGCAEPFACVRARDEWPRSGSVYVVDEPERALERQRAGEGPRVIVAATDLARAQAWHSVRSTVFVPPVRARREEIPAFARFFTREFARELRLPERSWDDEALAFAWRQPWNGNVRALANAVHRLVARGTRAAIGAQEVGAVLRAFGQEPLARLDSRAPSERDLRAALRTTRTAKGRTNKTRAALYLGWDPDTLVLPLKDASLDLERAPAALPWYPRSSD